MTGRSSTSPIIGGGVNGCGIARDAAGRGLSVVLCEQNDLASGTSSASTKLIHGGLRYLEHYEFRLVREALIEREVLLARSRRTSSGRCASCCRITRACGRPGCCGSACSSTTISAAASCCRPTRTLDLRTTPPATPLKPRLHAAASNIPTAGSTMRAWSCSTRAMPPSAAPTIRTAHARAIGARARRRLLAASTVEDADGGRARPSRARALVNAAGPWVERRSAAGVGASTPASASGWSRAATSSCRSSSTTTAATSSRTPTAASSSPSPTSATSR